MNFTNGTGGRVKTAQQGMNFTNGTGETVKTAQQGMDFTNGTPAMAVYAPLSGLDAHGHSL